MTLVIRPNIGVGELAFGMSQAEVRSALAEEPVSKGSDTRVPSDFFSKLGLIIHYTDDGRVEAIEMGTPAAPTLSGKPLLGERWRTIEEWLRSLDSGLVVDAAGLTSPALGIGIYAPHAAKSTDDPVEGVIVFRPGYYDS